jgi:hypothetical protein
MAFTGVITPLLKSFKFDHLESLLSIFQIINRLRIVKQKIIYCSLTKGLKIIDKPDGEGI